MEAQDPDINNDDVVQEQLILDAVNGSDAALNSLLASAWMSRLIAWLTNFAWTSHRVDVDEHGRNIRDVVLDAIWRNIRKMENRSFMCASLRSWCKTTVIHHCDNVHRHQKVEQSHWDSVAHEYTVCIRNEEPIFVQCSNTLSQQDELERQEQEIIKKRLIARIRRELRQVFNSFAPDDKLRATLWAEEKTLKQIAIEFESNKDAVKRTEKKKLLVMLVEGTRKAIIEEIGKERAEEIGIDRILEDLLVTRGKEIRELVVPALQETSQDQHDPRACL